MSNIINKEIASVMGLFPLKYPAAKYNTPQKKFKVIINELFAMGIHACIITTRQSRFLARPVYQYTVQIGYINIKMYKTHHSAKKRIVKEYIKAKSQQNGNKEKANDVY
jgi:hypothetical protein